MARRQPSYTYGGPTDPGVVASLAERIGLSLLVGTLPIAVLTLAGLLIGESSLAVGIAVAADSMEGALTAGSGIEWLFRLSVFGTLIGCWLLGAGLVLDGLYD